MIQKTTLELETGTSEWSSGRAEQERQDLRGLFEKKAEKDFKKHSTGLGCVVQW
jgi:hypothetical protein